MSSNTAPSNKTAREVFKEIYYDWAGDDAVNNGNFDEHIEQHLKDLYKLLKWPEESFYSDLFNPILKTKLEQE